MSYSAKVPKTSIESEMMRSIGYGRPIAVLSDILCPMSSLAKPAELGKGHAVTMVFDEKRWHYLANLPTTLQVVQADGGYEVRAAADAACNEAASAATYQKPGRTCANGLGCWLTAGAGPSSAGCPLTCRTGPQNPKRKYVVCSAATPCSLLGLCQYGFYAFRSWPACARRASGLGFFGTARHPSAPVCKT